MANIDMFVAANNAAPAEALSLDIAMVLVLVVKARDARQNLALEQL